MRSILDDVTYSATKAYSYRGGILDSQTITSLTESSDLDELVTKLKATAYADSVSRIDDQYTARKIEKACYEHVSDIHSNLMKTSPGGELISKYYLKHIARNLKVILKSKALGKSDTELEDYVDLYTEELVGRRDLLVKVMTADTLEDAVDSLSGTEFSKDINTALKIYKENPQMNIFDVYIDRAYHTQLVETYSKLNSNLPFSESIAVKLRPIISHYIDSYNVVSVLRAKQWNFDLEQIKEILIQPTFDIKYKKLLNMSLTDDVETAMKMLENTPYKKFLPSSFDNLADSISLLDSNIKKYEYDKFNKVFVWNAFTELVTLALIRVKEFEASNIATIAFGIANNIEKKTIQENLTS
ncbi:MAG: hypothetical protein CMO19_02645 [Thaumarchaeota archaeon]|nr:hypothetical protein [Nitrososphaerota archaeon]|tara:strand:+ start:13807 stop:14877 length:1071 start_codon:yes stop_codon:yes gene_type:complete